MWKSAYVGVFQLSNWKMHGETLKNSHASYFYWYLTVFCGDSVVMLKFTGYSLTI